MPKYTLGEITPNGLRVLLKDGQLTKATASITAIFHDDAKIYDGVFRGGEFHGGVFHDGWFHGGEFRGGEFHGGWFRGGVFHDGEFRGGEFHGGWFRGGVFHDGEFRGGVFHDGWLPLQIQGSKALLNVPDGKTIQIGCQNHTPEFWLGNYKRIGQYHGYSSAQIAEYFNYIELAAKVIKDANL